MPTPLQLQLRFPFRPAVCSAPPPAVSRVRRPEPPGPALRLRLILRGVAGVRGLLGLLALLGPAQGWALAGPSDPLQLYAGLGYFYDDNLFRLAEGRPAFDRQRSDAARVGMAGLLFDHQYGRQRLQLQGKLSRVAFNHFEQLDYNGKDFLARLDWQLGNRLEGKAGATYAQTLAPYTDLLSSERNLRVQKRQYLDAAWRAHPRWRLRGGVTRDQFTYELRVQQVNNRDEKAYEAGFDYLPKSGSTVGLVLRRLNGDYLNRRQVVGGSVDDSFTQDELKTRIDWKVTKISSIQALAGYARRRHRAGAADQASGQSRDQVSGFNGRVTASLQPREKLRATAALWREFSAIESSLVSFSRNTGASAGVVWNASAKLRVDASLVSERRAYEGAARVLAGALPSSLPGGLNDRLSTATAAATWTPRRAFALSASVSHQKRRGAVLLGSGDFKANTVSINANAQF